MVLGVVANTPTGRGKSWTNAMRKWSGNRPRYQHSSVKRTYRYGPRWWRLGGRLGGSVCAGVERAAGCGAAGPLPLPVVVGGEKNFGENFEPAARIRRIQAV